ncbi:MAG: hypothetical protein M0R77_00670 [Gammaproteobacteria bacterium]|nr:hypothetical protein [Acholeplasmataceae bacterium]MCK9529067.1 hypothetical protein [Gammaproteobacteria bacterium]
MFVIKGFAPHAGLFDNNSHAVNEVGEIHTLSLTYAKDKGVYSNKQQAPNITIISFECQDEGVDTEMPIAVRDHILAVSKFVYDYTINNPGVQVDHVEILNELITAFSATAESFSAGAIRTDGTYYVPEFVSWTMKVTNANITIWFSDSAFRVQYPNYTITVVPPIEASGQYPLDIFFRPGAEVQALLEAITMTDTAAKIQAAKEGYPETYLRVDSFNYHDPNNSSRIIPSDWGILIYGIAGNNIDSIKDAIQDHILSNSNHTREEWAEILPDIFKRTEFVYVPVWNKLAVPDQQAVKGIYSSVLDYREVPTIIQANTVGYPVAHINNYSMVTGWPWRSLAVVSIGSNENRDAQYRINEVYPDWIAVSSTDTDFNRMTKRTRDWFTVMQQMIYLAEDFQDFDIPPNGILKVFRNGKLYLTTSIENINHLVLCKKSMS